jgi:hypothetical protein
MSMFKDLLIQEGLIKLPKNVKGEMIKFFVRMYLAYYQNMIEEDLVGKQYYEAKQLADETAKEYDVAVGESDMDKVQKFSHPQILETFLLTVDDLPYNDKLKRLYPNFVEELKLPIKIKFMLDFSTSKNPDMADFDPNDNTIRVVMNNLKLMPFGTDLSILKSMLNKHLRPAIGVIEHELTHAMQHIVLERFHKSQIENAFDVLKLKGMKKYNDAYLNSQIEFDPWIKGEIAIFKSIEREMTKMSKEYDKKLSLEFFLAAKGEKKSDFIKPDDFDKLMFTAPSAFFLSLKKHNVEKWKKAVKLFYQGV